MRALFAEMMGKTSGVCGGRGGSQHLQWRNFYSNGVQGGIAPIATGMAFAEKLQNSGAIAICFLGDGTMGQGAVYEALNMASLWKLPVLYVVENNGIAQTTPIDQAMAGSLAARFEAFGIPVQELASFDVLEISAAAKTALQAVRDNQNPQALILHTQRFGPHSKGDDTRDSAMVEGIRRERDPLAFHRRRLPFEAVAAIESQVGEEVKLAFEQALQDPPSTDLGGESLVSSAFEPVPALKGKNFAMDAGLAQGSCTVLQSLNDALHLAAAQDERIVFLGEDILDPYGGAFKVTRGLSSAYPNRVIATPISEAGIVGVSAGLAMRNMRPVVEIMFGDFLTLAADQVVNHISKFHWMYNEQVKVPLLIRTPMGGHRGYGPTHSQTLEKFFLGVPGLLVAAPSDLEDPGEVLLAGIRDENPVLWIENKLLYLQPVRSIASLSEFEVEVGASSRGYPTYRLAIRGAPRATLTLAAYGYMGVLGREAVLALAYQHEIFAELIVLTQLSPPDVFPVITAVAKTGRLLTLEEGTLSWGWGAEVIARISAALGSRLKFSGRIAALDLPVPAASALEKAVLPGVENIVEWVRGMGLNPKDGMNG
jgi:2-oxoisovalerate dehydrogenase E1 component